MTIELKGRIDSNNASQVEERIRGELQGFAGGELTMDAAELAYISSAGLRVLLRLRKQYADMRIINVNSEVYEILDMTGFTEMMPVEKAYRVVSVEGCEEIGRGANGTIYRIDQDNVVKVYNNADALADIQHEREVAKLALILGIPTAISYDVVKVGESYGSVFELLNARSFSKILSTEPEKLDWCVKEYVDMLKRIHSTVVPKGKLPDMKETALMWARFVQDYLPPEAGKKLLRLIEEVPHDDHMIHGDYHTKNLELQNGEVLLIDMDTLSVGDPVFEFAQIYLSFVGYPEGTEGDFDEFIGFRKSTGRAVWEKVCRLYWEGASEEEIAERQARAMTLGYARLLRRILRKTPDDTKRLDDVRNKLEKLIGRVDSLSLAGD